MSDMWFGVAPRIEINQQIATCLKEIGLHAQNMITILESIANIIGRPI